MWIIALLAIIIFILLFGPVVSGLTALTVALGLGLVGVFMLFLAGFFAFVVLGMAAAWVVWWIFDPQGAMEAKRAADRDHARKKAGR